MYYDPIECGTRIAHLRTDCGLTQIQTAEKLNISVQHYRALEAGRRGASIEILVDITVLFHSSLDYVVLGKKPEMSWVKQELRTLISGLEEIERVL